MSPARLARVTAATVRPATDCHRRPVLRPNPTGAPLLGTTHHPVAGNRDQSRAS